MPIHDAEFDREAELEQWVFANRSTFFGNAVMLPGRRVTTLAGKHAIPDGFVFDLADRSWWVVECELLSHGVWPHIAEQLTRFVVAVRNPSSLRRMRDVLFESLVESDRVEWAASALQTTPTRLLQQLELFIETVGPSLAIFIDDTNQDLHDFAAALNVPVTIFRVKKLIVDGSPQYYSPDKQPIVVTEPEDREQGSSAYDAIETLGGGELLSTKSKIFRLADGRIIKLQYSKFHEQRQSYWFGITPSAMQSANETGCTDFVFVLGEQGLVAVPIQTIQKFLASAHATLNSDETVRHYHVHISPPPEVALQGYANCADVNVSDGFIAFS